MRPAPLPRRLDPRLSAPAIALMLAGCGGRVDPRVPAPVEAAEEGGGDVDPGQPGAGEQPAPADGAGFGSASLPSCAADGVGAIDADELPFVQGARARYRINPLGGVVTVDVKGEAGEDAGRVWDFTDVAGELHELALRSPDDHWTAEEFPDADLIARLDPRATMLGVYSLRADGVDLIGAAGEAPSDGTLVRYSDPVPLLEFPLAVGDAWQAEATAVDGRLAGLPYAARDRYEVAVDAQGEVRLGIMTFPRTLRVRIKLTRTFPIGAPIARYQYLWLTECWGEVARVSSRFGETTPQFTEAEEFRRLGL